VYTFFDVSTCSYEIYPEELFHELFPYFLFGSLFRIREACFYQMPGLSPFDNQFIPSACVPVLWSRRIPIYDFSGWGETRRLPFDDWLKLDFATKFPPSFWNTSQSLGLPVERPLMIGEFAVASAKDFGSRGARTSSCDVEICSPLSHRMEGYTSEYEGNASECGEGYTSNDEIFNDYTTYHLSQATDFAYLAHVNSQHPIGRNNDFTSRTLSHSFSPNAPEFIPD
jgi:hypothetical protein